MWQISKEIRIVNWVQSFIKLWCSFHWSRTLCFYEINFSVDFKTFVPNILGCPHGLHVMPYFKEGNYSKRMEGNNENQTNLEICSFVMQYSSLNLTQLNEKLYNSVVLLCVAVATTDVWYVVWLIFGRHRPFKVPLKKMHFKGKWNIASFRNM
jgi:hypothetical protein